MRNPSVELGRASAAKCIGLTECILCRTPPALLLALLLKGEIEAVALQSSLLPVSKSMAGNGQRFFTSFLKYTFADAWRTRNQCTSFAVIVS